MRNLLRMTILGVGLLGGASIAMADENLQYQQRNLPGGGVETKMQDGNKLKLRQVQHANGVIETHAIDSDGNETVATQLPDGTINMTTKMKGD